MLFIAKTMFVAFICLQVGVNSKPPYQSRPSIDYQAMPPSPPPKSEEGIAVKEEEEGRMAPPLRMGPVSPGGPLQGDEWFEKMEDEEKRLEKMEEFYSKVSKMTEEYCSMSNETEMEFCDQFWDETVPHTAFGYMDFDIYYQQVAFFEERNCTGQNEEPRKGYCIKLGEHLKEYLPYHRYIAIEPPPVTPPTNPCYSGDDSDEYLTKMSDFYLDVEDLARQYCKQSSEGNEFCKDLFNAIEDYSPEGLFYARLNYIFYDQYMGDCGENNQELCVGIEYLLLTYGQDHHGIIVDPVPSTTENSILETAPVTQLSVSSTTENFLAYVTTPPVTRPPVKTHPPSTQNAEMTEEEK